MALAAIFCAGLAAFVFLRVLFVPSDFGRYGHYRSAALEELRVRPIHYSGQAACEECHTDEAGMHRLGKHAGVRCEACHGPLADHAADPSAVSPRRPQGRAFCLRCHALSSAKPQGFPQIDAKDHGGEETCVSCHPAHRPEGK